MTKLEVISAAKEGDLGGLSRLADQGYDLQERDENGWTPLNWASGKGHHSAVQFLINRGVDVSVSGLDGRTAYMIARAAGHAMVADLLRNAEESRGIKARAGQPYCRAFKGRELLQYQHFGDLAVPDAHIDAESIVFVHRDFTVTSSMWYGENAIVERITPEWKTFCELTLQFQVPPDVE